MRDYEVVYIYDASLDEEAINEKLERYHDVVAGADGGEVTALEHWGSRQLAYPIKKHRSGHYVVTQFTTDPSTLPEFERLLQLDDDLIRYLIVLSEGEPASGLSILAPAPPRDREDEEEDEEEDDDDEEEEEDEEGVEGEGLDEDEEDDDAPPEFSGGRGRRRRHDGPAVELLNYKDVSTLARFITEQGKILPRRTTKVTSDFQRQLSSAVKRARYLALLPYVRDHEA